MSVASDVRKIDCWYNTSFNALVKFDNGATGIFLANWRTGGRRLAVEMHSIGISASADVDGEAQIIIDNAEKAKILSHTKVAKSEELYIHQGFKAQSRAFIDAVRKGKKLHNSLEDSVKTMKLVDTVYANAI